MKRYPYSAGGVKFSFWFREFNLVVELLANGISWEEIQRRAMEENLFAASSTARAKLITNALYKRITALDESFIPIYLGGDITTQKLFVLTGILGSDTLFFDFVYEVYRDKLIIGDHSLTTTDFRVFFSNKQRESDAAAKWVDETIERLSGYYKTILLEAGILTKAGLGSATILPPLPEQALENWWQNNGYEPVYRALLGVD